MTSLLTETNIRRISELVRQDPGQRGFATLVDQSPLQRAAELLLHGNRIVIVTGFCIRAAMIGENDGLSGSLALADALRELGKEVELVTDRHSAALLAAASPLFGKPFPTLILSQDQTLANAEIDALLDRFQPSQVVAIERPGSAADGHRYSMRGEILDDLVPAADRLLTPPGRRNFDTVAIGDGGNELGLGGLREQLKDRILHGELIFCATPADHVIPAGISNWGAHALAAALSLLSKNPQLIRPATHERRVLEALRDAGAVDGCTRKCELSVDGIDWDAYSAPLMEMHQIIEEHALRT